jgi:hypothetical protein
VVTAEGGLGGVRTEPKGRMRKVAIAARVGIVLFAGLSAAAFSIVSSGVGDEPPLPTYRGWVAVLQASDRSNASQAKLSVGALQPGGIGQTPALGYTVIACGASAFHGVLLAGGGARLMNPEVQSHDISYDVLRIHNSSLGGPAAREALGPVLAIKFVLPPTPCPSRYTGAPQRLFGGRGLSVAGLAMAPVQHRDSALGVWSKPRATQAWPMIGTFPNIPRNELGEWHIAGLGGSWIRPSRAYFELDVAALTGQGVVEQSRPPLGAGSDADISNLNWYETSPFQASARIVNLALLSDWQKWQVVITIWLTLAFALAATALYELVPSIRDNARPSQSEPAAAERPGGKHVPSNSGAAAVSPARPCPLPRWVSAAVAAAICCWALLRNR